jgi:hypothetical protein
MQPEDKAFRYNSPETHDLKELEREPAPRWMNSWKGGWCYESTWYEVFAAFIMMGWARQMCFFSKGAHTEPVATAMNQIAPAMIDLTGVALLICALLQLYGTWKQDIFIRRGCLLFSFAFYLFAALSFWHFAPYLPGASIIPVYAAAAFTRFLQLSRREH